MIKFLVSVANQQFGKFRVGQLTGKFYYYPQLTFGAGVYTGLYLSQNYEVSGKQSSPQRE